MSSSAQEGPTVPKERRGLGRVLSRMRTVLRRGDSSKRGSTLSTMMTSEPAAEPSAAPAAAAPAASQPAEEPKGKEPAKPAQPLLNVTKVPRSQIYEERAQKLGERFGLDIRPTAWHTEGDALRMEKPIRMRVHHHCHVCKTSFGLSKECPSCKHQRCKECTRLPPRRTPQEKEESRKRRAAIMKEQEENRPIIPDWDYSRPVVLTRPSLKPGAPDLVHKKPRQRVRRHCHNCKTLFTPGNKVCQGCQHVRCTDCPRDPPKAHKYPYGYPGDEFGEKSIPHYECHECKTVYPPNPAEGTECSNCSHQKCDSCERLKPRKVEPEPDPEILKSLQTKMAEMGIK